MTQGLPVPFATLTSLKHGPGGAAPETSNRYEASPRPPCGVATTEVDFGMSPRPHDTTPDAWSAYQSVMDEMDGPARLHAAIELSEAVREIRIAGLRARYPELSDEELVSQVVREEYGVSLTSVR